MEQLRALASRIEQLQAADLPPALQGLLRQAQSQLKPPSRSAAAAPAAVPATRQALVSGVLLLLEHAARLAAQQQDFKLVKEAVAQLVAAFQQHGWLWELLLHKHLPDLLQHPAAAQLLAKALGRLPAAAQARALHVWLQKLAAQPELAGRVPLALAQLWLEQLEECFQARRISLPVVPGLLGTPAGAAGDAAAGGGSSAAAAAGQASGAAAAAEVHVVLREQLPHLLQLLLLLTCSGGGAGTAAVAVSAGDSAGSPGKGADAPCLSSMQSAATELRPARGTRQQQQQRQPQAADSTAAGSSASAPPAGRMESGGLAGAADGSRVQEGVLRHAVLLVSQLSDPDALHSMLGIQHRQLDQLGCSDSNGEPEQQELQAEERQRPDGSSAAAAAAAQLQVQQRALSQREEERVRAAQALIEVCLDGMLTLQPLAAAVHDQLHSKGNSSGGGSRAAAGQQQHGSSSVVIAAAAVHETTGAKAGEQDEQAAAAAAELRHTAGRMLGLHRELARLLQDQQQPGTAGSARGGRQRQPPHLLSLAACPRLLEILATVQPAQGAVAGASKAAGAGRRRSEVGCEQQTEQGSLALLLMPPQLVPHGLELVRQAVGASSSGRGMQGGADCSWCAELAERVAALYASCYQAMWGAQVLQSAEAYQLLLPAARMRMLLRAAAGSGSEAAASTADGEAEAAAEAALLAQNAVGGRQRRQRSNAHELPGLSRATHGAAAAAAAAAGGRPPAKRLKPDPCAAAGPGSGGGNAAVAELLQLFQPAAGGDAQKQQQKQQEQEAEQPEQPQQEQKQRKRIQAVPVKPQQQQQEQQHDQQPGRKRIAPQPLQPAPGAGQPQQDQEAEGLPGPATEEEEQAKQGDSGAAGYQRVIISKTDGMTDEEQEALWEAYIADKEFLLEMLGDSEYQQWYDEAAHPLCKQQRRPGGLEAAWAAVLGGPSARSLVQLQLPRSLLEASGSMPWDAAAAACLRLLHGLLYAVQRSGGGSSASDGGSEAVQAQLLQRAFGPLQREAGARAATRICHMTERAVILPALKAARDSPAGGSGVLLAAQLLSLLEGHPYFAREFGSRAERELQQRGQAHGQHISGGGRLVAPPLVAAYARLLVVLLPAARAEQEAAAGGSGRAPQWQRLHDLVALMARKLLLLPPPVQHLLGGDSAGPLLRLALPSCGEEQAAAEQPAALLWMLLQQQLAGNGGAGEVLLPADAPAWLEDGAAGLLPYGERSKGHTLLLGPMPEARQAAAAQLLSQLQQQVQGSLPPREQQGSSDTARAALSADDLLPAADACHAAIQLLLAEHGREQQRQRGATSGALNSEAEEEEEDEEQAPLPPLLLGCVAAVAGLAGALCHAGAAAAAELARQLDAAAARQRQPQQQHGTAGNTSAAAAAAAAQAVFRQLLEPAVQLLEAGCLPPSAAQQLQAAIESLNGQLEAVQQLAVQLPGKHALVVVMLQAWEAAPTLWQPAADRSGSDSEPGGEGSDDEGPGPSRRASQPQQHGQGGSRSSGKGTPGAAERREGQRKGRRRKRLRDVRNPAVRAMLAEDGGAGDLDASDLSDLEDFLVFNPERDYAAFFRRHFHHVREGESDEEEAAAVAAAEAGERPEGQQARPAQTQTGRQHAENDREKRCSRDASSKKAKRKRKSQDE